jgi:hypothetical protein
LICRLLDAKPTIFQSFGGSVYYISAQGVDKISDPDGDVTLAQGLLDVVALVDADGHKAVITPRNVLMTSDNIRIILTSSPRKPEDRKWLKQLNVPEHLWVRMMDIWSEKELIITG